MDPTPEEMINFVPTPKLRETAVIKRFLEKILKAKVSSDELDKYVSSPESHTPMITLSKPILPTAEVTPVVGIQSLFGCSMGFWLKICSVGHETAFSTDHGTNPKFDGLFLPVFLLYYCIFMHLFIYSTFVSMSYCFLSRCKPRYIPIGNLAASPHVRFARTVSARRHPDVLPLSLVLRLLFRLLVPPVLCSKTLVI